MINLAKIQQEARQLVNVEKIMRIYKEYAIEIGCVVEGDSIQVKTAEQDSLLKIRLQRLLAENSIL